LPNGWAVEATSPKSLKGGQPLDYGYFWWPAWATDSTPDPQGAFAAIGIFGQYIYLNPKEHVVIVLWSARSKPVGMDIVDDMDFFAATVAALH
jgi:CubicO group peptidase (beta-lactamase class C family)